MSTNHKTYMLALIEAGLDVAEAKTLADKKYPPEESKTPVVKAKAKAKAKPAPEPESDDDTGEPDTDGLTPEAAKAERRAFQEQDEDTGTGEAPTVTKAVQAKWAAKASTAGAVRTPVSSLQASFKGEQGKTKTIPNADAVMRAGGLMITVATADGTVLDTLLAEPRTFGGGSWGWFANARFGVPTPGGLAMVSSSLNLTVSGSKKAHDQGTA